MGEGKEIKGRPHWSIGECRIGDNASRVRKRESSLQGYKAYTTRGSLEEGFI